MKLYKFLLLLALLSITIMGCKMAQQLTTEPSPTPAPTAAIPEATATLPATEAPTATPEPPSAPVTEAPPTATEAPAATPTPAGIQETEQARGMTAVLERLAGDGAIGSTQGEYHRLDDFDESMAKLGYIQGWNTGYSAKNFVLTANTSWQSAYDKSNWPDAGCGVIFSTADQDNYILAFLGLDGYVNVDRLARGNWAPRLARKFYGKVAIPDGDARLLLAVYENRLSFYVNDERVATVTASNMVDGNIALTVLSGTNKDYGTRCRLTDIDLVILP